MTNGTKTWIDATAVGDAFKALRREGMIARQRFMCCGGCASAAIADDFKAMPADRRAKVAGAVYFHKQDADRMDDGGTLFVRFGRVAPDGVEPSRGTTEWVGAVAVARLREAGLRVVWDGRAESCIEVKPVKPNARQLARRVEWLDAAANRRRAVWKRLADRGMFFRAFKQDEPRAELTRAWLRTRDVAAKAVR